MTLLVVQTVCKTTKHIILYNFCQFFLPINNLLAIFDHKPPKYSLKCQAKCQLTYFDHGHPSSKSQALADQIYLVIPALQIIEKWFVYVKYFAYSVKMYVKSNFLQIILSNHCNYFLCIIFQNTSSTYYRKAFVYVKYFAFFCENVYM